MKCSTPDAPPGQVTAGQTAPGAPAAGSDRPAALTAYTADIAAAILGCPF